MRDKSELWLRAGQTVINDLVLHRYHDLGMSTAQFMVYLELKSYLDKGISSPDINLIATHLGSDTSQIYEIMHEMIQQKLMTHDTEQDAYGKQVDVYNFDNLISKIINLDELEAEQVQDTEQETTRAEVFNQIEVEFGRPLSPIELETVSKWLDEEQYLPGIITLALQEAVLNQAWSLKYMDRILSSWDRQNLKTVQAVEQFKNQQPANQTSSRSTNSNNDNQRNRPQIPIYKISEQ